MSRIAVMGSGAWGTALAISLGRRGGHDIRLWSWAREVAAMMREQRENAQFLAGFRIPAAVTIFEEAGPALEGAEIVVSVTPSQFVRSSYEQFAPHLRPGQMLVSATKGIEDETCRRMSEVIGEVLAGRGLELPIGVLSGPSFAQEVAAGAPTAVTIASADANLAALVQREFSSGTLRLYTNDDVVGVELGGSLKNVIAIAAGIVSGLGLGFNSNAALITRGIAEITRLAVACGGRRETLAGLSGVGDLVLTCTGSLSRNRTVGVGLGQGRELGEILAGLEGQVAEGVRTTSAALGLARRHGVEMPIAEKIEEILMRRKAPERAIEELMLRPGRDE
ncbi:MAG TPA: NAD(P)H-dependent glycerol-3-phosphate dehydrogenase [Acidobacteriaceae bacterium]|jgi:glycerol-3-phosphate dehydrogenase (NAD(P)+)|nr:NAD(P)H-dependent glycerol-3-phosphate dehydrogenase [Acidobacteriaceae bacterium]